MDDDPELVALGKIVEAMETIKHDADAVARVLAWLESRYGASGSAPEAGE